MQIIFGSVKEAELPPILKELLPRLVICSVCFVSVIPILVSSTRSCFYSDSS